MSDLKEIARTLGGRNSEYRTLHLWVERKLGKPQKCTMCCTSAKRRYHWANISGQYKKDLSDWRRLCVPCHKREKYGGNCRNGHILSKSNTYIRPNNKTECRICKKANLRAWRASCV